MMKYTLKAYSIMEYGQRKDKEGNPHQEDAIWPTAESLSDTDRVFVLCDGMGGHDAGEVASQTVSETLGRALRFDAEGLLTDATLQQGMAEAYNALDARDTGGPKKMGTTMTLLALDAGGAVIAHLGDSRVYHFRPGNTRDETVILHRTEDHSVVNEMVRLGEMTEEEARHAPNKNVITRAMQPNMARRCRADVFHQTDILPGDYFMLCSDGILEQLTDANLRFIFSGQGGDAANKLKILLQQTKDNSDNHTAFLIEITGVEGDPTPRPEVNPSAYPLLAFPNRAVPTPVTIKTVNAAAPQPAPRPAQETAPASPREEAPITWEERQPEVQRGHGIRFQPEVRRKRPVAVWVVAIICIVALIAVVLMLIPSGEDSSASYSNGPDETAVDVGYEEVNNFNRRQEAEQSAIDAAARQARSTREEITGPDEAVGDPNDMWSSTDQPSAGEASPAGDAGVSASERVESAVQSMKRSSTPTSDTPEVPKGH